MYVCVCVLMCVLCVYVCVLRGTSRNGAGIGSRRREARGGGARERPDLEGCREAGRMGVGGEEGSLAANRREDLVSKGLTHSQ